MAGRVNGDIEILVHAGAPSGGRDDARYRALASAYLQFEPISHQRLLDVEIEHPACLQLNPQQPGSDIAHSSPNEKHDNYNSGQISGPASFENICITRSLHPSLIAESLRLSFSSCLDNSDSPALMQSRFLETPPSRPFKAQEILISGDDASWHTPLSVIADSQPPCNRPNPELSSPTRALELYLQHFKTFSSPLALSVQDFVSGKPNVSSQFMSDSSVQSETSVQPAKITFFSSAEDTIDIVLATPPLPRERPYAISDIARKRRLSSPKRALLCKTPSAAHASIREDGQLLPGEPVISHHKSSQRRPSQSSPPRKRLHVEECIPDTQPRSRTLSTIARMQIPYQPLTANEIHPPPPETSSSGLLLPNITADLKLLAMQLCLPSRFRPRYEKRRLRPLERGYWSVSMMAWGSALRERVWNALKFYIAKQAKAGWGVWCVRCESKGKQNEEKKCGVGKGSNTHTLTELRVYCWGEVVGHVYLLLHLVSERKIKGSGARWIDGEGEAVIVMS